MRITMLLENNPYPHDVRVRLEAEALRDDGHEVTVVAPRTDGQPRREEIDGVRVRRFRMPPEKDSAVSIVREYAVANVVLHAAGMRALLAGADAIHMHNPPDTLFGVSWMARLLRRRAVFDLHDVTPELFLAKFGEGGLVRVLGWFERRSVRAAHHVVTTNESMRRLAVRRGGIPPGKVSIVRNAPPQAMRAAYRPGRDGVLDDPRLVFVGSMESQDGIDDLVEMLRRLHTENGLPGATLTMVGHGSRREALRQAFMDAGLGHAVTFTGRVAHAEVPGLLASADIGVEPAPPSPLNHCCSMVKVYEYMAAGRPIVGYELDEVRHLCGDRMLYAAGGPASLAAGVARLARDPALRAAMGDGLRERAARFTWEAQADVLRRVYRDLARGRRPAATGDVAEATA